MSERRHDRTGERIEPPEPCPYDCRKGWLGITEDDPYPDVMRPCPNCRKPREETGINDGPTRLSPRARQARAKAGGYEQL